MRRKSNLWAIVSVIGLTAIVVIFAFNILGLRGRILHNKVSAKVKAVAQRDPQLDRIELGVKDVKSTSEDTNVRVKDIQPRVVDIQKTQKEHLSVSKDTNTRVRDIQPRVKIIQDKLGRVGTNVERIAIKHGITPVKTEGVTAPPPGKKVAVTPAASASQGGESQGGIPAVDELTALLTKFVQAFENLDKPSYCSAVAEIVSRKGEFKPKLKPLKWAEIENLYLRDCKKKKFYKKAYQMTLGDLTQGTCLNTLVDKVAGKETACHFNIKRALSGYTMTGIAGRVIVPNIPDDSIQEEVARFYDNTMGMDWFGRYTQDQVAASMVRPLSGPDEIKPNLGGGNPPKGPGTQPAPGNDTAPIEIVTPGVTIPNVSQALPGTIGGTSQNAPAAGWPSGSQSQPISAMNKVALSSVSVGSVGGTTAIAQISQQAVSIQGYLQGSKVDTSDYLADGPDLSDIR